MKILKVTGISKSFEPGVYALSDVSLALEKGEILGVLGPNGAGKTTLIHTILGLISPSSGWVEAFGTRLSAQTRASILRRMNFASSYVSLPLTLTPRENMMVYALMYGIKDRAARCDETLGMFGLEKLKNKPSRTLSSGQMMRLALAKAMINGPEILLLDEPTAGLDPEIARKTRHMLKSLCSERGMSVIYTSHNLWEMQEVSDRVLFMKGGKVLMQGRSADLLGSYGAKNLEELFFKALGEGE